MMFFMMAALAHGAFLFHGRLLMECAAELLEPTNKAVKATVDGKPVYSYVADD
jgi:hypothetical protein